jgi:lactate dehydrogenase-like 2-hydroxyacid dehydrogenase
MNRVFEIGVTPDFYVDARGKFEKVLEEQVAAVNGVTCRSMPPQPGKLGTPDAINQFDAIFALALKFTPHSLEGVDRTICVARWGVGYDMIDVDALTAHDIVLSITPKAVRRPVAEAILTFIFALNKNLFEQDRLTRRGGWRSLGSVGCGNIAQELFRLAGPLGFGRMIACDPVIKQDQVKQLGVEIVDMDAVFRESDFVCVNTLLNAQTRGLVAESCSTTHWYGRLKRSGSQGPVSMFIRQSRLQKMTRCSSWITSSSRPTRWRGPRRSCATTESRPVRTCWP